MRLSAETSGREVHAYQYESLANANELVGQARPNAMSHAEALTRIDPALTLAEAALL